MDANNRRLLGWNVLCRYSTITKVVLCRYVRAVNWDKLGNTSWNREYQIGTLITLSILLLTPMLIVPTIHAERENKLLFPKSIFPQSDAYKTGWAAGFLG